MTHVTVVQVCEPHLGQVQGDGKASVAVSPGSKVAREDRRMICQEGSFAPKECLAEILYVNVMELRQGTVLEEGTSGTRYPSVEPQESVLEEGTCGTRCPPVEPPSSEDRLRFLSEPKNRKRRLSRKSSIMNQNVGVTGGVFMKSDPESEIGVFEDSDSESESSLSASESSLSGSDSGLSSTIEVGMSPTPKHSTTITIGDEVSSPLKASGEDTIWLQGTVGGDTIWLQKTFVEETHCINESVSEKTSCLQKSVGGGTVWHQKIVDEETLRCQRPAGEDTLWRQEAIGEETLRRQKPAGEETLWRQKTAGEETPWCQKTAGEEKLWRQKTAGEETLWRQKTAGEETPWCQKTAGEETLGRQKTAGEETLWRQKSAGEETFCRQEIIGEETLRCQKTAGEETLWCQETVVEETLQRQTPAGEETLRCQKPAGEVTLWRQKSADEETLWRQKANDEEILSHQKSNRNETFSLQKGILLHVSPKSSSSSYSEDEDHPTNSHPHDEIISIEYSNFEISEDLSEAAVTLEWRVIPPSHPVLQHHAPLLELEGDRGLSSTPTSFSSAYTVTENESTSEESESSRNNWSGPESDEEPQDKHSSVCVEVQANQKPGTYEHGEPQTNDSEIAESNTSLKDEASAVGRRVFPIISDSLVKEAVLSAVPSVLRRLRRPSEGSISSVGEENIVYSYIPCRDQREKEDEELWVANEAADPRSAQAFNSPTPPLLPPPVGWEGVPGSLDRAPTSNNQQANPGTVYSEPSCGVDVRASDFPGVGPIMCTVAPTIAGDPRVGVPAPPRKHYSTRQRPSAEQILKFKVVEEERQDKGRGSSDRDIEGDKVNLPTSLMTRKPTKRFSFLVRSNSVKQEEVTEVREVKEGEVMSCNGAGPSAGPASAKTNAPQILQKAVTPSDQAILDKLASLNIETPAEVKLRSKPRVSLYDPPCTRCGDPVYPQERTEPTLRLVFHSSCFKCHHCGVRLTLKTFYRSPLDSRDTRLFCRSHVPTLDPGKLDAVRSDSSASSGKSSPDCAEKDNHSDVSRGRSTSPSTCIQERLEIVKCDTIGLRYF